MLRTPDFILGLLNINHVSLLDSVEPKVKKITVPVSAYTSFLYSESMAPAHRGPRNGLPKASMAELLVAKQDPNSCDWVG